MVSPEASDGGLEGPPPRKVRKDWLKVTVDRGVAGSVRGIGGGHGERPAGEAGRDKGGCG